MLRRFLAKEHRKEQTEKRGGRARIVSLDAETAEQRYQLEPANLETPERLFERRWAATLLDEVMGALRREYELTGRLTLFEELRGSLSGDRDQRSHLELGEQLGMSEGAVKVAVHRLRKRYGELLRAEIARTMNGPGDIDAEIRYLIEILG
jgi:RNA polymerase sigma-70 factor (ECF subfamily)